jgi:hypothetical protein
VVRSVPRTVLLPGLGFTVLLAVALALSRAAEQAPSASLYRAAADYVEAVYRGRGPEAARYFARPVSPEVDLHLARLAGRTGFLLELETSPRGDEGLVTVFWADAQGRPLFQERQRWARGEDRAWRIVRLETAGAGRRRAEAFASAPAARPAVRCATSGAGTFGSTVEVHLGAS